MPRPAPDTSPVPIGQFALHQQFGTGIPPPVVQSFVVAGARRTRETRTIVEEFYPPEYRTDGTVWGNLRFAFRHEPLDLLTLYTTLQAVGTEAVTNWVRTEPTGAFSRRLWFFYETLMETTLDLNDAKAGNYVDALDTRRHFTATPRNSPRHRVRDNLLGTSNLCPTVRRTPRLTAWTASNLREEAANVAARYPPETLARAANFLYTKETRSSFALEGEALSPNREQKFLQVLQAATRFDFTHKDALIRLQGSIVDPRYAARDWRSVQNFVGETTRGFGEYVHFICPRPDDVPLLMRGWTHLTQRLRESALDPVLVAAVSSFAFVFVHPFEDGNGRIHRFLIHALLAAGGFTPPGVLFPVSAALLRQRTGYDQALEAFSKPILAGIEWDFTADYGIRVHNDTRNLYRFFDATVQTEFLYERVAETIRVDFKAELDFLEVYDASFAALRDIVDMPDRRAALLLRFCLQNGGRLSRNKRGQFAELTDDEIARIGTALQQVQAWAKWEDSLLE